jgi:hypothetical protein
MIGSVMAGASFHIRVLATLISKANRGPPG